MNEINKFDSVTATNLSNNHFLHVQSVLVLYTLVLNLKVAAVVINLMILLIRTLRIFIIQPNLPVSLT